MMSIKKWRSAFTLVATTAIATCGLSLPARAATNSLTNSRPTIAATQTLPVLDDRPQVTEPADTLAETEVVAPQQVARVPLCPAEVKSAIDTIVRRPQFAKGRWGILVQSLDGKTTFYDRNGQSYFIPASNIKLLTTAAALQLHEPSQRFRSLPLADWVKVINERSNNNYADTLLSDLGGSIVVRSALSDLGIKPTHYRMMDGSGLSRRNMVRPVDILSLLQFMDSSPNRDLFRASLPVAGISGTLRNRMRRTPAQGVVQAKTGTLRGVRALSGYLQQPEHGDIVFSIFANHLGQSGSTMAAAIDEIVVLLTQMKRC